MPFRARIALLACLSALAAGCTTIDQHEKVAGWPELKLVEHYVPDEVMRKRCSKYVPFGMFPEACAEFYFDRGECHVWYSAQFPPQPFVKAHERLHCQGYGHPGSSNMKDILARYQAAQRAAAEAAQRAAAEAAASAAAGGSAAAVKGTAATGG